MLHPVNGFATDNMLGLRRQGHMERDDIATFRQVGGLDILDAVLGGPVSIWERIVGQDMHPEAAEDLGHDAPDLARADDAGGLAVQVPAD